MFYHFDFSKIKNVLLLLDFKINDVIEMIIIAVFIYYILKHLKNTRMYEIAKGVLVLLIFYCIALISSFQVILYLIQISLIIIAFAAVVMLQAEIKKFLEMIGSKGFREHIFASILNKNDKQVTDYYSDETITEIIEACRTMGEEKTGALILLERKTALQEYVESGIALNADVTRQLLINIFEKNTPLHDGAVVIDGDKIVAATCILTLSNQNSIDKKLGTRHRAAIGASENTDALIIIVSEETGAISIAYNGKIIHDISFERLESVLKEFQEEGKIIKRDRFAFSLKSSKAFFLSILFTFLIWMSVTVAVDPVTTVTISNIPVKIINTDSLTKKGYVYDVEKGDTVNVTVTGAKSVLSHLKSDDFTAVADASERSLTNSMKINVSLESNSSQNVSIDTDNAMTTIKIEREVSKDCVVETEKSGTEGEGYFVTELFPESKTITVTGPKSVLKTIDHVLATVDISGATADFTATAAYVIYDKNGNEVDLSKCEVSAKKVKVEVKGYPTKMLPVKLKVYDSSKKDAKIKVEKETLSTNKILVAGEADLLADTEFISIKLDLASSESNKVKMSIDPENYMPEGLTYAGDDSGIDVSLTISESYVKTIKLKTSKITVKNGSGVIKEKTVPIKIRLNKENEDEIDQDSLEAYIDLKNLDPDTNTVKVQLKKSNLYEVEETGTVTVDVN